MPRNLDSATEAEIQNDSLSLAFFAQIAFKSETSYISTLPFDLNWDGNLWKGAGDLGSIGTITEGTDIQAYGISLTLSGIDVKLLDDALNDIQLGLPATVYMMLFDRVTGAIIGTPTVVFAGQVDKTSIKGGVDTVSITMNIESPMINLGRGQFRRLTSADQHIEHPDDVSMDWVPQLNFMALRWGQS